MQLGILASMSAIMSAKGRRAVLDRYSWLSEEVCNHLVKILTIKDRHESHWIKEVNGWLKALKKLKTKTPIKTETYLNELNDYEAGSEWAIVLEYCDDEFNFNQDADIYSGYKKACGKIPSILTEFIEAPVFRGLYQLNSYNLALKDRGDKTFHTTADALYKNKSIVKA